MASFTPQQIEEFLQEFFDVVGTRQYIGARYVPIFGRPGESSIDWDNSSPYEPLTIVLYQGSSYTSRQYVPAGVDINNAAYWANTGNYNSQVEQYRREVVELQNDWQDWKTDTEGDIASWETTAMGAVMDYASERNGFAGANCLCITDSWGSEGVYGVTTCWMRYVCNALRMNYIDLHQGSTGYCMPPTFLTRAQAYAAANPDMVPKINYILISGSSNDASYPANDIANAINTTIQYLLDTFTNAIIYFIPQISGCDMNRCSVASTDYNVWTKSAYASYAAYLRNSAAMRRVVFVNQLQYLLVGLAPATYMNADCVHPKQVGHDEIARTFLSVVIGGGKPKKNILTLSAADFTDNLGSSYTLSGFNNKVILYSDGTFRYNPRMVFPYTAQSGINSFKISVPYLRCINAQDYELFYTGMFGLSNYANIPVFGYPQLVQNDPNVTLAPSDPEQNSLDIKFNTGNVTMPDGNLYINGVMNSNFIFS